MLYPIGIQSFEKIRQGGYVYVDKTDLIYKIAKTGQYYFLSRPRRFGKSLLLSTMEAYFRGRKELFDGLAIASLEKDWTEYPVLHLDLGGANYADMDALKEKLGRQLNDLESEYGVVRKYKTLPVRFETIIEAAYRKTGRQVVILVDEYDKPVIDNLNRPELQDKMRETLRGFYGVMKSKDGRIRLGFLTGVTKIGKMSVFSDLNNPKDISMDFPLHGHLRSVRDRPHGLFRGKRQGTRRGQRTLRGGVPPKAGPDVRRLPLLRGFNRGLQPVQPSEHL